MRTVTIIACGLLIGGIAHADGPSEKKLATLSVSPVVSPGTARGHDVAPVARSYDVIVHNPAVDLTRYAVKLQTATKQAMASGVNTSVGIVTCAHVVDGHPEFIAICDGETATAKVVSVDNTHDLALLSVTWNQSHPVAELAKLEPVSGDSLTSVGRQKDGTLSIENHALKRTEKNEYQYSNPPQSGRSGSGVFDTRGNLLGIVIGSIVDTEPYVGRAAIRDDVERMVGGNSTAASSSGAIRAQVVISCWPNRQCPPGEQLKRDIVAKLTKLGWSIGTEATNQIRFAEIPTTIECPQIEFYQNGVKVDVPGVQRTPESISVELRKLWDAAGSK